jgi:hypothetical protein
VPYRDILVRQTNTDHIILSPLDTTNVVRSRATATCSNSDVDPGQAWITKRRSSARSDMDDKNQMNNDAYIDTFDLDKYPIRELRFYIPGLLDPIVFNPMVSLLAVGLLWGVVIYTIGTCTTLTTRAVTLPRASFSNVALLSSRIYLICYAY